MTAAIWADAVPILPAAREYVHAGIAPGGTHANWNFLTDWVEYEPTLTKETQLALVRCPDFGRFVGQRSEGSSRTASQDLRAGCDWAAWIGEVTKSGAGRITVRPGRS